MPVLGAMLISKWLLESKKQAMIEIRSDSPALGLHLILSPWMPEALDCERMSLFLSPCL